MCIFVYFQKFFISNNLAPFFTILLKIFLFVFISTFLILVVCFICIFSLFLCYLLTCTYLFKIYFIFLLLSPKLFVLTPAAHYTDSCRVVACAVAAVDLAKTISHRACCTLRTHANISKTLKAHYTTTLLHHCLRYLLFRVPLLQLFLYFF